MHHDHPRRLDNLLRLGTIAEVDYANATARVKAGGITTDFLPWITLRAGDVQTWSPVSVGEQVLILAVSGEFNSGIILAGVYASNAPNQSKDEFSIHFPDGCVIRYNHASGHLSVENCKTATIQATQSITADTPSLTCTGDVTIQGSLTVQGAISTSSSVTASGEVSGKGINLSTHTHSGVESGSKRTGTP
ncbi:phage baseplate assembly protein V [Glaesserella parasuis]|nr:phage baseplate assembly protein V [Glaesserella parasuis]